jgi:dimethylargininase
LFTHAIVRPPSPNFADGLTTVALGVPDVALALEQHAGYCRALVACGLAVTHLDGDPAFPDSTFVEDTAVIVPRCAVLTRPGAASRAGEVVAIRAALRDRFTDLREIVAPGTVDGGDICETDRLVVIGISHRTNDEGGRQLAACLGAAGHATAFVDIRGISGILHLKSGVTWLGDNRLLVIDELAEHEAFRTFERIIVAPDDGYAANAVRVNDRVLVAAGFPRVADTLARRGYAPLVLDMSEFRKMDGGLSCLSLRF